MQKTIDLMSSEMDYIGGVIFIYQEDINALVPWFHTNSKLVNFMATFLSRKFRDYIYLLNRSDSVIVDSFNQNELVVGEGMTTLRPIVEKRYTDFVTRYIKAKSCLSIPLYLNDQGVGLLWVTTARDKILEEEIQIMKSMSDYLAINIFNSLKFKTLKDKEQKF